MSSRATAIRSPQRTRDLLDRDFPDIDGKRRAVCRRCHLVMDDCEPNASYADFWHIAKPHQTRAAACVNNNYNFTERDSEIEPFMRKARRRHLRRAGIRA